MSGTINFFVENQAIIIPIVLGVGAEVVARLVPTEEQKGALERLGKGVNWLFDILKIIPNRVKR